MHLENLDVSSANPLSLWAVLLGSHYSVVSSPCYRNSATQPTFSSLQILEIESRTVSSLLFFV